MNDEPLINEFKEMHSYTRMLFPLLVGWFTFYLGIISGGLVWVTSMAKAGLVHPFIWFFTLQTLLGIAGCVTYILNLIAVQKRGKAILDQLAIPAAQRPAFPHKDPAPNAILWSLVLMILTLLSELGLFFWMY